MTLTWMTVAMLLLLHTAWSLAHAITNRGRVTAGFFTPHRTLPYVWGGAFLLAVGQTAYFLAV